MEKYNIIKVGNLYSHFLVIANTVENPINTFLCEGYVPFVENGEIIFDLAVINGVNSNRFVQTTVQCHRLQEETIRTISEVPFSILETSKKYFETHNEVIQYSVLLTAAKHLLANVNLPK